MKTVAKNKKMSLAFSVRDGERLALYASDMGVSRPAALRRIVHQFLADYVKHRGETAPANQLDIFDSVQIDIFNNATKTV